MSLDGPGGPSTMMRGHWRLPGIRGSRREAVAHGAKENNVDEQVLTDSGVLLVGLRQLRLDVVGWVNRRLNQESMNFPQYTVMQKLDELGELTMGTLSENLGTTMGAATNLVDKLVHAGHVVRRRSARDRRVVQVKLTEQGLRVFARVTKESVELLGRTFRKFSPEERQVTVRVITEMAKLVTQDIAEATRTAKPTE